MGYCSAISMRGVRVRRLGDEGGDWSDADFGFTGGGSVDTLDAGSSPDISYYAIDPSVYGQSDGSIQTDNSFGNVSDMGTVDSDGTVYLSDGSVVYTDGSQFLPDGTFIDQDGNQVLPDGIILSPDGSIGLPDGTVIFPDGTVSPGPGSTASGGRANPGGGGASGGGASAGSPKGGGSGSQQQPKQQNKNLQQALCLLNPNMPNCRTQTQQQAAAQRAAQTKTNSFSSWAQKNVGWLIAGGVALVVVPPMLHGGGR